MDLRGPADTRRGSSTYDPEQVKYEVLDICDYYLRERRKEGRRFTYRCPGCGGRRFEVEPVRAMAGCFSAECELPKTTDALGIIAYMESLDTRGPGFIECLKKGYEILGLETEDGSTGGKDRTGHQKRPKKRSWVAGEAIPDNARVEDLADLDDPAPPTADQDNAEDRPPGRLIEAYAELPDGSREPLEAFVVDDDTGEIRVAPTGEGISTQAPSASGAATPARRETYCEDDASTSTAQDAQREINHKVFERLLGMCKLEDRDREFLIDRGLDETAIRDGRFGSISKKRCRYVTERLEKRFPDEELLTVPGFYRADTGQLRFTLYGEYALIPYYDRDGYIRTVEGRLTGEPSRQDDPKYKALAGSGVHLYVHPRFDPGEVVAFCEGAIGAMVAARCGIPVAAIKGMRNYRQPPEGRHDDYSVLPELAGVDFADSEIVYIPDVDVKPKTREEALGIVPEACEWLIERQGGRAKAALLPEGAKDLDEWLLSLAEEDRVPEFMRLLREAVAVEQWDPEQVTGERVAGADHISEETVNDNNPEPARDQHTSSQQSDQGTQETRADRESGGDSREDSEDHVFGGEVAEQEEIKEQDASSQASGHETHVSQRSGYADYTSRGNYRDQYFKRLPEEAPEGISYNDSTVRGDQQSDSTADLPDQSGGQRRECEDADQLHQESSQEGESAPDERTRGTQGTPGHKDKQGSEDRTECNTDPSGPEQTERRTHPGMQWWYDVSQQTPEQAKENRRITEMRDRVEYQRPRGKSARLDLKKWNFGEVVIAVLVTSIVAIAACAVVYAGQLQGGLVETAAGLITWPVWWIEAGVYVALGWGVAVQVSKVRYVSRCKQLLNHVQGKKS
jgi:hypothetical protein